MADQSLCHNKSSVRSLNTTSSGSDHWSLTTVHYLAMRTGFRIDAPVGQPQPLDRPAAYQVFFHDLRRVFGLHEAIPHCFGIDHHRGAVFTLIQAKRFVDAHAIGNPRGLGQLLQLRVQLAFSIGRARGARRARGTNVVANEDVVFKRRQSRNSSWFQTKRRSRRKKSSTFTLAHPLPSAKMIA